MPPLKLLLQMDPSHPATRQMVRILASDVSVCHPPRRGWNQPQRAERRAEPLVESKQRQSAERSGPLAAAGI
ncbi:hypothetical protein COCON_G00161490 [Conger conger]|uniref:Uncharacterized protein n=1 Tax=Conger conger TaxID=82655 RepID=A0A9Q1HTN3_CONCO|nr:hypothetical protein COCON_G00161490 [Conger conger]